MRSKLILMCLIMSTSAFAQVSPGSADGATQQRQTLLSRIRGGEPPSSTRQQLQREPVQVAQPANTGGYQPGVTYPQQPQQRQQQPQQQQLQSQQPQPQYQQPGYPPQQMQQPQSGPQQPGARPTPTPTPTPRAGQSTSNSSRETPRSTRTSSRNSDSDDDAQKPSTNRSSSSNSSSNSSRSAARTTKASDEDESKKKTSSNSTRSSALEKIVKNVESGKSSGKEESDDEPEEAEVKKTEEEIAAEKARAIALKAADEATTVVAGFLKQANDGYYSKASESLAPAIQKYFESEMSAVNGTQKTVLDELTANGTINMVTYINTTVRGEGAVVEAELGYGDGRTTRRSFDLVNIKDGWKIVLPVKEDVSSPRPPSATVSTPIVQTDAPAPTPTPETAPPTAEQAASRGPLVLVPPTTNPGSLSTTAPAE